MGPREKLLTAHEAKADVVLLGMGCSGRRAPVGWQGACSRSNDAAKANVGELQFSPKLNVIVKSSTVYEVGDA